MDLRESELPPGCSCPEDVLLEAALRYSLFAPQYLGLWQGDAPATAELVYGEVMRDLRVHFLFPNLTERDRATVSALANFKEAVEAGINAPTDDIAGGDPDLHECAVSHGEQEFMRLRAEVQKLLPKLTAIQRRLIEAEYLTIRFQSNEPEERTT